MSQVSITVNGRTMTGEVEDRTLLVQYLRDNLGLTGTHVGCDTSQCGACVVHIDGTRGEVLHDPRRPGLGLRGRRRSKASPTGRSCTPCRPPSASITGCSAATARRA